MSKFLNIATQTTTQVDTGAGVLRRIVIPTPVANATVKVYDNTAVGWTGEDYNNFYGFSSNTFQHTLGANDLALDPQRDSRYLPRNASLINAGTYLGGYDYYGKEWGSTPNIGAVENWPARSTATRTVGSFTPASSSRTIRTRTATI
jgi:hypothetical protein